jgi:hypothetical protein
MLFGETVAVYCENHSHTQSHITTDGQPVSQSVSQYVLVSCPFWCRWPDVCYCLTITVVPLWGALSDERSGLSIVRQRLHFQVICQYIYKYLLTFQMFDIQIRVHTVYLRVARGSVVVMALCYNPEGSGFDSRWGEFLNLPNPSGRTRPWGLLSLY